MFVATTDAVNAEITYRQHRLADQFRFAGGRHHHRRPRRHDERNAATTAARESHTA